MGIQGKLQTNKGEDLDISTSLRRLLMLGEKYYGNYDVFRISLQLPNVPMILLVGLLGALIEVEDHRDPIVVHV